VIEWDKKYKFILEKEKIDGRGNLISIYKQGEKAPKWMLSMTTPLIRDVWRKKLEQMLIDFQ
jgi:hypothetical protein